MIVKVLGFLDLLAAFTLISLTFGISVFTPLLLFLSGILLVKGLFIFGGEPLSLVDLVSCILFLLSIFFGVWPILLWTLAFFLLAKGIVSFL